MDERSAVACRMCDGCEEWGVGRYRVSWGEPGWADGGVRRSREGSRTWVRSGYRWCGYYSEVPTANGLLP